jgi:hypothetical protein
MRFTPKELAEKVTDFVNGGDRRDVAEFVKEMSYQHRTLQQMFTGICLAWLNHLSKLEEHQYDLRNEASVKTAKKIKAAVPDIEYGLPLI